MKKGGARGEVREHHQSWLQRRSGCPGCAGSRGCCGDTFLWVNVPRPGIRFPTSHANEGVCAILLLDRSGIGSGDFRGCGDLDAPLQITLLPFPPALSRVCRVSASPGGVGTALANVPCPPLQPHPVLSRSLSAYKAQP